MPPKLAANLRARTRRVAHSIDLYAAMLSSFCASRAQDTRAYGKAWLMMANGLVSVSILGIRDTGYIGLPCVVDERVGCAPVPVGCG